MNLGGAMYQSSFFGQPASIACPGTADSYVRCDQQSDYFLEEMMRWLMGKRYLHRSIKRNLILQKELLVRPCSEQMLQSSSPGSTLLQPSQEDLISMLAKPVLIR
jgi:hypothetical protein